MAEKRMISKSISVSEKVNLLPDIFDMLLFTWIIPHTDDFGRLAGSPAKVKALVVPMLDKSIKDVEQSLGRLAAENLLLWYEVDGSKYIQIVNFEKHQSGLHKRTNSKIPEPIPGSSGKFREIPLEQNRTEEKRTELEEKRTELEEKRTEEKGEENRSVISSTINSLKLSCKGIHELELVTSYVGMMEIDLIVDALKRAESNGKVSYALGILKDWASKGYKTLTDSRPKPTNVTQMPKRNQKPVIPIAQNDSTPRELTPEEREEMQRMIAKMGGSYKIEAN